MTDSRLEIVLAAKDITSKAFDSVQASITGLGKSIVSVNGMIAGFAGATGLGLVVKQSMDAVAEIDRLSTMAGVEAGAFQELSYAAGQYQITQDALTDGLKELALRGDEFVVDGAGPGKDAFERLGYSAKELNGMLDDTPGLLRDIISRMEGLDKASQIRIADELFGGTGGEQFVSMIQGGARALDGMRQSAHDLGVVIDDGMVKQSVEARKQVQSLTTVLSANFTGVVAELAPDIIEVSTGTLEWVKANKTLINQGVDVVVREIGDAFDFATRAIDKTSDAVETLISWYDKMPKGLLGKFMEAQYSENGDINALIESINNGTFGTGAITKPIDSNTPGYDQYVSGFKAKKNVSTSRTINMSGASADEAKKTADAITAAYSSAYASLDTMTQSTFDAMMSKYKQDYDAFIKLTGDKSTAMAMYSKNVSDLTEKMYGADTYDLDSGISDEYFEEMMRVTDAFQADYKKATMSTTAYELDQLKQRYEHYSEFIDDTAKLDEWYSKEQENIKSKAGDSWSNAFSGWATGYASELNDMLWEQKLNVEDLTVSLGKMATQWLLNKSITESMEWAFGSSSGGGGGFFGSLFSSLFHTGGVVGSSDGGSRSVSPMVFADAPRFHSGLMPDEFAAILQRGETVFTANQTAALGSMISSNNTAPNVTLNIENKTNSNVEASQSQPQWDGEKWVIGIVLSAINNNTGNFRTTMKAKLSA